MGVNANVEDHASAEILKDLNALFHVYENKENQSKKKCVILKAKRRNTIKRDIFLNLN